MLKAIGADAGAATCTGELRKNLRFCHAFDALDSQTRVTLVTQGDSGGSGGLSHVTNTGSICHRELLRRRSNHTRFCIMPQCRTAAQGRGSAKTQPPLREPLPTHHHHPRGRQQKKIKPGVMETPTTTRGKGPTLVRVAALTQPNPGPWPVTLAMLGQMRQAFLGVIRDNRAMNPLE
jgi:hypothetical protein